MEVSSL